MNNDNPEQSPAVKKAMDSFHKEMIAKLEASLRRYEAADDDEVDSEEYESVLTRLVKLREMRSSVG